MHAARLILRGLFIPTLAVVFLLFLAFGKTDAQAQTYYPPSQTNQFLTPNTNPNVPHNQHTFIQSIVIESMATGICLLSGYDVLSPTHQCLGIDPYTNRLGLAPVPKTNDGRPMLGGALGGMSYMIGGLYAHPPVSSIEYVHYMAGKFGFDEKAYAQAGYTGYANLYDLRLLWRKFRNVAYGIMVIAFVIIGIAIMLRVRIDPRTVMTVQNQIPKIIIGILLITFSYAIAGFMVDLMWFTTYFGIDAVASTAGVKEDAVNHIIDNPVYFVANVMEGGIWGISRSIGDSLSTIVIYNFVSSGGNCSPHLDVGVKKVGGILQFIPFVPPVIPTINIGGLDIGDCIDGALFWIGKYIFTLIVLAAILIALVRLWFTLLKAYAYIILDVIAAPLWIAAGAIPGSSLNFSSWFRHLTAHLLLFPVAGTIIVLARTLQERFLRPSGGSVENFFTPPLLGNPGAQEAFVNIIVLAILMMLPELMTILRDALRSKPLPYTAAVGRGIMAGAGAVGAIASIPKRGVGAYTKYTSEEYRQGGYKKRGWRSLFG